MNPHQVDAALFALKSPLSKGVLLADEVGLGKTIEAGLVMSQRWAEQRQRILLVVPASLRKQWSQELHEKFSLRSRILEAKTYNELVKAGHRRPFEMGGTVTIASYEFAARKADEIRAAKWDLVIFDEAHRLRNVWNKAGAKGAKALRAAVGDRFKILLTATPLQNSLMELFGLVSMIDEMHFGGENAFRSQFVGAAATPASQQLLRDRLVPICHRTLRRQVQEAGHINFRKRHARTFTFEPYDNETRLYEMLSEYLQDPDTIAYGGRTNALVVLQARKQLGSSTFATAQYLGTLLERLRREQAASVDMTDDLEDVLVDESEAMEDEEGEGAPPIDPVRLAAEIELVSAMRDLAVSIGINAKGEKLVQNLPSVLDEIESKGGRRKAVIFTESVRTQRYLAALLSEHGYAGQVALMNGSNADPESRAIYDEWKTRHAGTDRISGSRTADMKAAIVEAFKGEDKAILIATESGAEGINLQFCSLLINYDLPWNPQRVEQRIGRCHRYGQLVDVTVVNMLNLKNRAEARIHELLEKKLHLFEGVFGASDDVLGILSDGIDFEREVLRIVQTCRSAEEADREFDELTARIQDSIDADVEATRAKVLENMDADVVAKLHRREQDIANILPDFERRLLMVAHAELPDAQFPTPDAQMFDHAGQRWTTRWKDADAQDWQFLRVNDGLGAELVERARARDHAITNEAIVLDPDAYPYAGKLSGIPDLAGQSGWLRVVRATMPVAEAPREELIVVAETDAGEVIPSIIGDRLLMAPAVSEGAATLVVPDARLASLADEAFGEFSSRVKEENYRWLLEEEERLSRYARDMEIETQARIAALDEEIKELDKAKLSPHLAMDEKLKLMRAVRDKQAERDDLVFSQHEAKKVVRKQVGDKLDEMAALLSQEPTMAVQFTLRWTVRSGALAAYGAEAA
ncbi:DEAD/DEAH box helicase [Novosphingobium sp. G106]|uniref:SNF2-related protein n=1 Tax=Novosphingobium sp. G106 TaxID=2849500 RepID=UPI001C2D501C|nr:SNF2-related protein [Novosphingobium sp. G106]MBV1692048.1 DEAD/DEAH box helicase [Novosphingobium sp. G106]